MARDSKAPTMEKVWMHFWSIQKALIVRSPLDRPWLENELHWIVASHASIHPVAYVRAQRVLIVTGLRPLQMSVVKILFA